MKAEPMTTPPTDSVLDCALAMGALGFKVVPIKRGEKYPPMNGWPKAATDNADTIRNWFNGLYRGNGMGWAMGLQPNGRYLFALDLDRHNENADGVESLAELEAVHGALPDTVRAITGGNGVHLVYEAPPGVDVYNTQNAEHVIAPGIDVRGEGGQIIVSPSVHTDTGRRYEWEHGYAPWEHEIAEAPEWLVELVRDHPVEAPEPKPKTSADRFDGPRSAADILRDEWDWRAELIAAGWTQDPRRDSRYWTRPGKDPRAGHSAVLHEGGPFVVFSGAVDEAIKRVGVRNKEGRKDGWALSPLAFYAATHHGGDLSAAGKALAVRYGLTNNADALASLMALQGPETAPYAPEGDEDPDEALRALLLDWGEFWTKDHGDAEWIAEPVIPAKRSVALFAPGGTGKSLLSLWLSASIATGRPIFGRKVAPQTVLYLDYEMTADDLAERLESMGFGPDVDLGRLHYALLPSLPGLDQPEGGRAVVRLAEIVGADLVIIDTFGRAVHGDENEADTVRAWYRWTGLHLKHAGRAFLRVDHAGKDLEKGQRGTSAKNDDVDVVWQMTKGEASTFVLKAKKRRMGWVPEKVDLWMRDDDVLAFEMLAGPGYPAGTAEVAASLDALGVAPSASGRAAAKALRDAGRKARNEVVRAAQRYRMERLQPVDSEPESAPRLSGRAPLEAPRPDSSGAVDGDNEKPQVEGAPQESGRGRARGVGDGGARRRSIERARSTPADFSGSEGGDEESSPPTDPPVQSTATFDIF